MAVHIDSFSGPVSMLPKGQRSDIYILTALHKNPRVSTFDMGGNEWLWRAIVRMEKSGLLASEDEPYPWHRYRITPEGMSVIAKPAEAGTP